MMNKESKETMVMTNEELKVRLDIIADNFNPSDEISVDDTYHEMHENWRNFLRAGCGVDSVARMMSPADVWEGYDELLSYGAKLDIEKLVSTSEFFDEDFIKEHWDELAKRGISLDTLADRCYANLDNIDRLEEALVKGVSVEKGFELIEDWFNFRGDRPMDQVGILSLLYDYGLPKAEVEECLGRCAQKTDMTDYIIEFCPEFCKKLGMDDDVTIDHWLDRNGCRYFGEEDLTFLPDVVSVDKLINHFSMREIIDNLSLNRCSCADFFSEYCEVGGEIDNLARKFVNEVGYSSDPSDTWAMLDLIYAGASKVVIDPKKFVNSIDSSQMSDSDIEELRFDLERAGYDEELIGRFSS